MSERTHYVTTYPINEPERRTITEITVTGSIDSAEKVSIASTEGISLVSLAEKLQTIFRIEKDKELGAQTDKGSCSVAAL